MICSLIFKKVFYFFSSNKVNIWIFFLDWLFGSDRSFRSPNLGCPSVCVSVYFMHSSFVKALKQWLQLPKSFLITSQHAGAMPCRLVSFWSAQLSQIKKTKNTKNFKNQNPVYISGLDLSRRLVFTRFFLIISCSSALSQSNPKYLV